ncbi:hypothetical protein [Nocardioides bizhenqiangii]|uniref:Sensor domain-containing protein n=1 Tax=Nocardioides bizhenqiangii TaxID=3095076 RepID=A0ABZ0ZSW6_9ACTN|nr:MULTISPECIES: hypothetical protein [unclassified Nocardioides]MDZ5622625.1 hypothetical protein [Nocardioides sp. HM23]WQQ26894.1 hypothetical protein SHK19_01370 [Nocardioides sp. HM61]
MRTAVVRPRRGVARALAPVAVLALVSALAAGCGDDDSDSDSDGEEQDTPAAALTADQIAQAVLQPDNMGEGWTSEPSTDDEGTAPGCLAGVETLTEQLDRQDRGGTEFSFGEVLTVESTVSAYAEEAAITAIFDQVQSVISACTTVTGPDSDGNEWNVTLATTDEQVYDDVDDQYSVSGSGTITTPDGVSFDIYLEQTAVRVGPNVASISTTDTQSRTTEHQAWAEIAVERLVDVVEGEEPEPTTAPGPADAA